MLTSASEYFSAMFATPMKESIENVVTMHGIAGDILESIISFCYTGTIQLNTNNINGIVAAASLTRLVYLEKLCEEYFLRILDRSNCSELRSLATKYIYKQLNAQADTLVVDSFQHFVHTDGFLHVQIESLEMLLKNENLFVYAEEVVFDAIVRWIAFDADNRKESFTHLMSFIRFDQLKLAVRIDRLSLSCRQ